jgi:hypothetical protein
VVFLVVTCSVCVIVLCVWGQLRFWFGDVQGELQTIGLWNLSHEGWSSFLADCLLTQLNIFHSMFVVGAVREHRRAWWCHLSVGRQSAKWFAYSVYDWTRSFGEL